MTITLPLPVNLANGRLHWRRRQGLKRSYYHTGSVMLYQQVGPSRAETGRPETRPMAIRVTLFVHQRMDRDNLMARCKWPVDLLKRYGLIRDDNEAWLTWASIPDQVVDRKEPRIEITLEAA